MKNKEFALFLAGLLLATATTATAGNKAESFSLSPVIGGISFEGKQHLETAPLYGLRAGYNFTKEFGFEALFDYARTESTLTDRKVDFFRYGGEALYHFMPDNKFVPYLAAGYGATNFMKSNHFNASGNRARGIFDYGVGAKFFVTDNIALRGDVRHLLFSNQGIRHTIEYTVGLYIPFGGAAAAAKPVETVPEPIAKVMDSDNDGVQDTLDKCPNTPAGVSVDKYGCPLDSDKDGVPDYLDKCPDTPAGVSVDKDGCPPVVKQKVVILASEPQVKEKVITAVAQKKSAVVVLAFEDVHFDFNKSELTPEAKVILKRDIKHLKDNPNAKVRVAGYTSASGTKEYNQKLSERRAKAVQEYLINEGVITRDRLSTIGYGETHPGSYETAPQDLYSDAAKANMRVLFEIIVE